MRALPEAELWRRYRASRDVAVRNVLVERHRRLARRAAERKATTTSACVDVDELESAAVFGLMDAVETFDPARRVRFTTFAAPRIWGAMKDWLREIDWVPRLVRRRGEEPVRQQSLSTPIWTTALGEPRPVADVVPAPVEQECVGLERAALRDLMDELCRGFTRAERMIVDAYYGSGLNQREIGEAMGFSESRTSQIHKNALARMKARAAEIGLAKAIAAA